MNIPGLKIVPLGEKLTVARTRRMEGCPPSARSLLARCWSKKASPRQAIKASCHECCGYDRAAIWYYRMPDAAEVPVNGDVALN
jgi:hypothetical protein